MTTASATKPATTRRSSQGQAPVGPSPFRSCSIDSPSSSKVRIESSAAAPPNGGLQRGQRPPGTGLALRSSWYRRCRAHERRPRWSCHYRAIHSGPDRSPADTHGQCHGCLNLRPSFPPQVTALSDLALQQGSRVHGRCSARLTDLVLVDDMSDGLISKEAIVVRVQFLESRQLLRASTPQLAYSLSQAEAVGASQEDSPPGLFRSFILASDLQADNLAD
jgi:hypothetical protein